MINDTPTEIYSVKGHEVYVKREDLACAQPGPPFAKVRGLLPFLKRLYTKEYRTVGYMETAVSMAGWGVSFFAKELGMRSVIYYPDYKDGFKHEQLEMYGKWIKFGAVTKALDKPNRQQINYYRARRRLMDHYDDAYMLPLGLPFLQTVQEVATQVLSHTWTDAIGGSVVCSVGSGTMTAGVVRGLALCEKCIPVGMMTDVYGILVSPKNSRKMRKKIYEMADVAPPGMLIKNMPDVKIIDAGFKYLDKETVECPFPCNSYYDRKAWRWLIDNIDSLRKPILFWNIGA